MYVTPTFILLICSKLVQAHLFHYPTSHSTVLQGTGGFSRCEYPTKVLVQVCRCNRVGIILLVYILFCRSSSLKVHGTLYKRGCWLLTGKQSIYGMKYPQFNVVIDILSQGDQHTPLLITQAGQHIKYVEHMRAYSVLCTATSPIEVICPSSLLYYEPFTAVIHDAEVIIKPRVDLYSVLED